MLDTFHPLKLTKEATQIEDEDYWKKFKGTPKAFMVPPQLRN